MNSNIITNANEHSYCTERTIWFFEEDEGAISF